MTEPAGTQRPAAQRAAARRAARRLPLSTLIALRYLRSTRRDAFVSFLSAVAAGGIGLGVGALVLALAALSGLQAALRAEVLARTPHLEVELPADADGTAVAEGLRQLRSVRQVQQMVRGRGWLRHGEMVHPVELIGYAGAVPRQFPGAEGGEPGLYVSDSLALRWALQPGAALQVISPRPTLTPLGPQPRVRSMELAGVFSSGRTEEGERVALPLEVARPLAGSGSTFLEITTGSLEQARALVPRVIPLLPAGATVRTWQELNRPLFFALRLEKAVMFVAVSLVVLVAAFALVADLALILASKRSELGMLGAMGALPGRLRSAFLQLGAMLALLGMGAGALLGAAAAVVLDRYRLVRLPGDTFFLDYLPFRVEGVDLAAVLLLTLALALLSSYFVAQRLERLRPVEALRP
jgi:lipoprotein-releasing system permease protein